MNELNRNVNRIEAQRIIQELLRIYQTEAEETEPLMAGMKVISNVEEITMFLRRYVEAFVLFGESRKRVIESLLNNLKNVQEDTGYTYASIWWETARKMFIRELL